MTERLVFTLARAIAEQVPVQVMRSRAVLPREPVGNATTGPLLLEIDGSVTLDVDRLEQAIHRLMRDRVSAVVPFGGGKSA